MVSEVLICSDAHVAVQEAMATAEREGGNADAPMVTPILEPSAEGTKVKKSKKRKAAEAEAVQAQAAEAEEEPGAI